METSHRFGSVADTLQAFENTRIILKAVSTMLEASLENAGSGVVPDSNGVYLLMDQQLNDLADIEDALRDEFNSLRERQIRDDRVRELLATVGIDNNDPDIIRRHLMGCFKKDGRDRIDELARYIGLDRDTVAELLSCAIRPHLIEGDIPEGEEISATKAWRGAAMLRRKLLDHLGSDEIHRVAQKLNLADDTVYSVIVNIAAPVEDGEEPETSHRPTPADLRQEFIAEKLKSGVDAAEIAQALNMKRTTVERVIARLIATPAPETPDQQAANG